MKRPNAIHLGSMANLIVAPTTRHHGSYGALRPEARRSECGAVRPAVDNPDRLRLNLRTSSGPSGSGSTRLGLEDGLLLGFK